MAAKMEILTYQNYLRTIRTSRGSRMFQRLYVLENNKKKDILKNGQLACAYYVSSILKIFDLISQPHTTVKSTLKDILKNNWRETKKLKPGNIIIWENKKNHLHIGFYLGKNRAISHCYETKKPSIHHYTYGQKRKIIQVLTHEIIK